LILDFEPLLIINDLQKRINDLQKRYQRLT